jgi:predicted metal-dependent hydrolase
MDKFIYAISDSHKKSNIIKSICATHFGAAQDKIIQEYWDKYDDLEKDEWNEFLNELWKKHGVLISKDLIEINELS